VEEETKVEKRWKKVKVGRKVCERTNKEWK
jgi:hypothetical protein